MANFYCLSILVDKPMNDLYHFKNLYVPTSVRVSVRMFFTDLADNPDGSTIALIRSYLRVPPIFLATRVRYGTFFKGGDLTDHLSFITDY